MAVEMAWKWVQRLLGLSSFRVHEESGLPAFELHEESAPDWPEKADALVLPGKAGARLGGLEDSYPADTTDDVVNHLRQRRLDVEYPPGSHGGFDMWAPDTILLPILAFTIEAIANGAGDLLADFVQSRMAARHPSSRATRLIVKVGRVDKAKKTVTWFEGEGPPDKVLAAMKRALKP